VAAPRTSSCWSATDGYFGEKPRLRRIVYKVVPEVADARAALETGEADIGAPCPTLRGQSGSRPNPKLEIQKPSPSGHGLLPEHAQEGRSTTCASAAP
jgi:ABC-type transport system substrate-binding protein